ncbi:hypothetical protein [Mycolicibacterium iranicum]|uniref:Uncharacterized protein n=1 Tax=Mycolicibacterium iranicum TaxID=912594 RepID=A0A178LYR9_MYCIR|nr:hypothetical protein [Mycolicibacterium iranicum]OAN39676.1 hypothetical protein A4X20_16925 [Mycolicibacterium iranicum]
MKKRRRADESSRVEPYAWLGASAVALGIGAALVSGAGAAHAEDGAERGSASASNSSSSSTTNSGTRQKHRADRDDNDATAQKPKTDSGTESAADEATQAGDDDAAETADDQPTGDAAAPQPESDDAAEASLAGRVNERDIDSEGPSASNDGDAAVVPLEPPVAAEDPTPDTSPAGTSSPPRATSSAAPDLLGAPVATVKSARQESPAEAAANGSAITSPVPVLVGNPSPAVTNSTNRFALAVDTLLKPVGTLLTELGGLILGIGADPLPPGACEDGVCNPTSDFYLPFVRNEVTVLNLTGRPVTLSELETPKPLTYGPRSGFVLGNARQVEMAFYQNSSEWDRDNWTYEGTMTWTAGNESVTMVVDAGGATASTSGGWQTVTFETPESISGPSQIALRETVVILPKAGTEITVDSTDKVGQAIVAAALCKVSGSCRQEVAKEEVLLSAEKLVGVTLFNNGTVDSTNRYKVTHEVIKTSGVEENLKVVAGSSLNFSLGPLAFQSEIGALVQQKYGHSWSDGVTVESQVDLDVPPGSYGQIYVQYPEYHDYVNMTITDAGVTIKIPDVEYVSLAPSGSLDPEGKPLAVTYTTYDWKIGTGPHPNPDSGSVPTPPNPAAVDTVTVPDISAPVPAPARRMKTLFEILGNYLEDQAQAFRTLPNVLFGGRAISSMPFRVVNLTPYPQTLSSITGEYEEDESPEKGFVLQPFEAIFIEVDYSVWRDQETYVTWTNSTGLPASAEFKVFNGGSAPLVTCTSAPGCMAYGYEDDVTMYLIYPFDPPGVLDITGMPNLASAAVDKACEPGYNNSIPGSCSVNATGDVYYTAPTAGPYQQHVNRGTQTNSYYYTVTTSKSETASWAAGGGVKLKEKAGVFVGLQIEIEASVLYNSSVQVKDSESSTVVQNLLPDYGGAIYTGDPYLRSYGDYVVNLPNLTMIVTGQWIEAASGLAAQGPVANVVDYPLS